MGSNTSWNLSLRRNGFKKQVIDEHTLNIDFIDVRGAFLKHGAYAIAPEQAFINPILLRQKEDLKDKDINPTLAYSIHPNRIPGKEKYKEDGLHIEEPWDGVSAYAFCVQQKIDQLEEKRMAKKKKPAEEERNRALMAYYNLLTGGFFNRDDPYSVGDDMWDPQNCRFMIAYMDDDDVPELLMEGYPADHLGGFGQLYTYKDDRIVSIRHLSSVRSEAEIGTQIGYYEKTGWMETFSMWQGYGNVITEPLERGTFWLSKDYEPNQDHIVQHVGYTIYRDSSVEKCDETKYYQEMENLGLSNATFIHYEYFDNTQENRDRMLGALSEESNNETSSTEAKTESAIQVGMEVYSESTSDSSMESATITAYDENNNVVWTKTAGPYPTVQQGSFEDIGVANNMYYYIDNGYLYTLNLETGDTVWVNEDVGGCGIGCVFDVDGTLYHAANLSGRLVRINKDGQTENIIEHWELPYGWPYQIDISENILTIYFSMENNSLQIDKNTFEIL